MIAKKIKLRKLEGFMAKIILIVLFYLVVTPIGLLAKLFGKDFLKLKFSENSEDSYWISKK